MSRAARIALFPCALIALALAGCAATRPGPPPEVAPQPAAITAGEAVTEGVRAEQQADALEAAAVVSAAPTPAPQTRARRSRPTDLSTEEIRGRNAVAPMPLDFPQRLDHAHDRVYTWGQRLVEATDHQFAAKDQPLRPVPAAPFRVGNIFEVIDRRGGSDLHLDINLDIALRLPNIEKRLRIFITSDELDGGPREVRQQSAVRAGLSYQLLRNLDFDVGIRIDVPPVAFSAVRWTKEYALGDWDFYPLAKLFAETKESFGYAAGTTFDRWSGRQLLRSSTYAKWRHDLDQTEWSQTLIYARAHELIVPDRYGSYLSANDIGRGWGLRVLVSGTNTDRVSRYEASMVLRGQTGRRWLYWHVEPLVQWDRAHAWRADPGIRIGFDALFWDLARPAARSRQ